MAPNARTTLALIVGASALLVAAWPVAAADFGSQPSPPASASEWQFNFTPYGWASWLQGDLTVRDRTVKVDVDPIELIDHLDRVPFMGFAEARKGPLSFYGDIVYANVGLDADSVRSRRVGPEIGGTLSASLGLDINLAILEAGSAYEIANGLRAAGAIRR